MSRWIDADALLGEPWHVSYNVCEISEAKANNLVMDVIGQCKSIVARAPTVEIKPTEPKKGYWKEQKTNLPIGTSIYENCIYHCSCCGVRGITWSNFCPNCGADMRDKADEE